MVSVIGNQINFDGYVVYHLDHVNRMKAMHVFLKSVHLKAGSLYKIVGVKLNEAKVPYRARYRNYYKCFYPYNLVVGKLLEIKVGILKKGANPTSTRYVSVAKLKVKNFIKKYQFPTPNSVITLANYSTYLPFNWKFAASPETTRLTISKSDTRIMVFNKKIRGDRYRVPKSVLTQGAKYKLIHSSPWSNEKFTLTRAATSTSKMLFSYSCMLHFKTL